MYSEWLTDTYIIMSVHITDWGRHKFNTVNPRYNAVHLARNFWCIFCSFKQCRKRGILLCDRFQRHFHICTRPTASWKLPPPSASLPPPRFQWEPIKASSFIVIHNGWRLNIQVKRAAPHHLQRRCNRTFQTDTSLATPFTQTEGDSFYPAQ